MSERIREHMAVIASDGVQVGVVDGLEGDRIKLTRNAQGRHRYLPLTCVQEIEDEQVMLSISAAEADRQAVHSAA